MIEKKYFRPKEIEQVFGIKTLSKQRQENSACPIPLWVETQNQIEAE